MKDIELVIRIPEEQYRTLNAKSQDDVVAVIDNALLIKAIKNGTPLPKGHTRLFDERDIVYGNYQIIGGRIYELEPIIEAESEVSNASTD